VNVSEEIFGEVGGFVYSRRFFCTEEIFFFLSMIKIKWGKVADAGCISKKSTEDWIINDSDVIEGSVF